MLSKRYFCAGARLSGSATFRLAPVLNQRRPSQQTVPQLRAINPFVESTDPVNFAPDFNDENWADKVTDWNEFWFAWDRETEDMDTEEDSKVRKMNGLDRAHQMIDAIKDNEQRSDMIQIMRNLPAVNHPDPYDHPPPAVGESVYQDRSKWEMRAIAEKRWKKQLMDEEWTARKDTIGKFVEFDMSDDLRIQDRFDDPEYREDWTDDEVYNLITNNGINCKPEDHGGKSLNPLAPADYVGDHGVRYHDDTEDFIKRIGHWCERDDLEKLALKNIRLSRDDMTTSFPTLNSQAGFDDDEDEYDDEDEDE